MKVPNKSLSLKSRLSVYLWVSMLFLAAMACNLSQPQVVQQTVVVVETATRASATDTAQAATQIPVVTDTPGLPSATSSSPVSATSTPNPIPSPTLLALKVVPIEGDQNKIHGQIIYPDISPFTTWVNFQVKVYNPKIGKKDGDGINKVGFCINNSGDDCDATQNIYYHVENSASYCAFGGVNPNCAIFDFTKAPNNWPGTNNPVVSGTYDLTVTVDAKDGNAWTTTVTFDIKYP